MLRSTDCNIGHLDFCQRVTQDLRRRPPPLQSARTSRGLTLVSGSRARARRLRLRPAADDARTSRSDRQDTPLGVSLSDWCQN